MSTFKRTDRNRIKRKTKRGHYDRSTIYRIIDEGLICHIGFVQNRQPFVIPTIFARVDDSIIIHGSRVSRLLNYIKSRRPVCITVTLLDGLVLARSAFHHSVNYRSVVLFGKGKAIETDEEKLRALEIVTERVMPGRWSDARQPNRKELNATSVVAIPIEEASAKVREGGPIDEAADYALPVWAGVLPIVQHVSAPQSDSRLPAGTATPDYVIDYLKFSRPVVKASY